MTIAAADPPSASTSAVVSHFDPDIPSCFKEGNHPFCSASSDDCTYEVANVDSITFTNEPRP